jgi:hypothetical protein
MTSSSMSEAIRRLRDGLVAHDTAGLGDGQLVERFLSDRDEAAFASLVRRHGPMVLGVCGRVLRNRHDAEDAFQATFLVLARKAGSVVPRELVGHWLYGVAYRTALRVRSSALRLGFRERQVKNMPEPAAPVEALGDDCRRSTASPSSSASWRARVSGRSQPRSVCRRAPWRAGWRAAACGYGKASPDAA